MNNKHFIFIVRPLAIACGALFSVMAVAADDVKPPTEETELDKLTRPKSTVEAGVGGVTGDNWKFGQYNGLNKSGAYGIGAFDIKGGGAYDSKDASRWRITGKNIGLENRNFTGEYKKQGKYKLNFGYDELPMYRNNSFRSPYLGIGGSILNLPNDWKYPTTANNIRTLPGSDLPDFHNVEIGTKRKKVDGGFSYFFDPQWEGQTSFRHEDKNGIHTLGAPILGTRSVILPNPIAQSTDQINASLKFTGDKGFGQFAYYGSLFNNQIDGITFQTPFAAPVAGTTPKYGRMSSAPDNQFHQFSLTSGYNFTRDTKLVANGSYARNWQNQDFLPYNTSNIGVLPSTNLNGDVETKAINLKLTHKVDQNLNFSSQYKYDERDNHTPINIFVFKDIDRIDAAAAVNNRRNTPFSKRIHQGNLDANYSFAPGHWLKAGYELQSIDRWCNNSWISCVDTASTVEHSGRIDYRGNWFDKLSNKFNYTYSHRQADKYNQDNAFWASFSPGLYPVTKGNEAANAVDIPGLERFNTNNRDRSKASTYFNYQATDKLSLGLGADYRHDNYPRSTYGLQSSQNWGINFDSAYAFNESTSVQLFYNYQDILNKSQGLSYGATSNTGSATAGSVIGGCVDTVLALNQTARTDPCRNWNTHMNDKVHTVGLGFKEKGLFNGKVDVNTDFLYSFARTLIGVDGGQYVRDPKGSNANGPYYYIRAANLPEVTAQTFQVKLDTKYNINKASAVHLSYLYQHLFSSDYAYTGTQFSGTPTGVVPTFEQAPKYSISAVGLTYMYNF